MKVTNTGWTLALLCCAGLAVQGCSDDDPGYVVVPGTAAAPATSAPVATATPPAATPPPASPPPATPPPASPPPATPPPASPPPPMGEMRAMWVTRWYASDEGEIRDAIRLMKDHGFNTMVLQCYGDGMALYPSAVAPRSGLIAAGFDQVETAIRLAHAEGIEVHAWLNVMKVWSSSSSLPSHPDHVAVRHPEWSMVKGDGTPLLGGGGTTFFCPQRPGFVQYLRDLCSELATNYPDLDGVHLDYIRYPGSDACYCSAHQAAFQAAFGRAPSRGDPDFVQWKLDNITDIVSSIYDDLEALRPDMLLSAAVFRRGGQVSQDTYEWLRRGKLDVVMPMIYTSDDTSWSELSRDFREHSGGRLVVPGINGGSNSVGDQIRLARQNGCHGFNVFASATFDATGQAETLAETGGGQAVQNARRPWKDGSPDTEAPIVHSFAQGQVTASAAVFTWSTDEATAGAVTLTDSAGNTFNAASTSSRGFVHRAVVLGLAQNTDYAFEVQAADAAGNLTTEPGTITTAVATSGPVVVDETSTGFSTQGGWISGSSSGGHDGGYLYHGSSSAETASATWQPALAVTGPYEVGVWYVNGSNRSTAARYEVTDVSGTHVVTVDQTQTGRQWVSLGVYTLDPLTVRVRLSNQGPSGVVIADATRFVPQ